MAQRRSRAGCPGAVPVNRNLNRTPNHRCARFRMPILKVTASRGVAPASRRGKPPTGSLSVDKSKMRRKKPYNGPLINIDPELVLNTIEAGRMLGVSDREVRAKIARGTLPAVKIGNKYLINHKALCLYARICKLKKRGRKNALRPDRLNVSCSPGIDAHEKVQNSHPYKALFQKDGFDLKFLSIH